MDQDHRGVRVFFRNGDCLEFPTADYALSSSDGARLSLYAGDDNTSMFLNNKNTYIATFATDDVRGYANMDIPFTAVRAA